MSASSDSLERKMQILFTGESLYRRNETTGKQQTCAYRSGFSDELQGEKLVVGWGNKGNHGAFVRRCYGIANHERFTWVIRDGQLRVQ